MHYWSDGKGNRGRGSTKRNHIERKDTRNRSIQENFVRLHVFGKICILCVLCCRTFAFFAYRISLSNSSILFFFFHYFASFFLFPLDCDVCVTYNIQNFIYLFKHLSNVFQNRKNIHKLLFFDWFFHFIKHWLEYWKYFYNQFCHLSVSLFNINNIMTFKN
jgi:hypothetical protein